MRDGRYAAGSGRTVAAAITGYASTRLVELRDQHTTEGHLDWWRCRLGATKLRDLSIMAVADAMDALAKEPMKPRKERGETRLRSPATLNRYKATLSAVLKWCQRRGWMTDNPARLVAARSESKGRVRFLTPDERARLLTACKASRNPTLLPTVVTLLATGARLMEVMELRWADVDLNAMAITVQRSKNGDARRVPLAGHAHRSLCDWRGKAVGVLPPAALVFSSPTDPTKPADLRRSWRSALKQAGITDFRRHDLRHSAASALASTGASLLTIGSILGHRSAAATMRYAHLAENDLRDAVDRAAAKHKVS